MATVRERGWHNERARGDAASYFLFGNVLFWVVIHGNTHLQKYIRLYLKTTPITDVCGMSPWLRGPAVQNPLPQEAGN